MHTLHTNGLGKPLSDPACTINSTSGRVVASVWVKHTLEKPLSDPVELCLTFLPLYPLEKKLTSRQFLTYGKQLQVERVFAQRGILST